MQEGSSHFGRRDNSQSRAGGTHDETTLAASRILKSLSGSAGAPMRPTSSGTDAGSSWRAQSHAPPARLPVYPQAARQSYHSSVESNHMRHSTSYLPRRPHPQTSYGTDQSSRRPAVSSHGIQPQDNQRLPTPTLPTSSANSSSPPSGPIAAGQPYGAMNYPGGHYDPTGSPYSASQQPGVYPPPHPQFHPYGFVPATSLSVPSFYGQFGSGPVGPAHRNIEPDRTRLEILQMNKDAQIPINRKDEKNRKTLDPPPILELIVDDEIDQIKLFRNSPNIFCHAHLAYADKDEAYTSTDDGKPTMLGVTTSTINKLKGLRPDANGEQIEGGYFVFGDISVTVPGTWRLRFTVYDIPFATAQDSFDGNTVRKVCILFSKTFRVTPGKDRGTAESTELTRQCHEQGVRLRLRKDNSRPTKRKASHRRASEEDEQADVTSGVADVVDKRQRYGDYTGDPNFDAGAVQPLEHMQPFHPASIPPFADVGAFQPGPVQPPDMMANYPHYLSNVPSRYQERVANEYNMLNGAGSSSAAYPTQFHSEHFPGSFA